MELSGESRIGAPRERVWAALNDPAVLARCIDGVEALVLEPGDGDARMTGRMNARVGPVRASFAGAVTLTEVDAPRRVVLVGEGKGGVAGFARGSAEVVLDADADDTTVLHYAVSSSVGGKLAQLGSRLIEGTAKAYAATFFERFKAELEGPPPAPAADALAGNADAGLSEAGLAADTLAATAADPQAVPSIEAAEAARGGVPPLIWGGALIIAVLALLAWQLA